MQGEITIPNFYEYIEAQKGKGVALSDAEMDVLRIEYTRYRNRLYKQRQRERNKEIIVFLNREEYKQLKDAATRHKLLLAHYIRLGALKYTDGTFITPNAAILSELLAELQKTNKSIDAIAGRKKGLFSRDIDYSSIVEIVNNLQNGLLGVVTRPVNVEQWITNELEHNEAFKRKLIALLLTYV